MPRVVERSCTSHAYNRPSEIVSTVSTDSRISESLCNLGFWRHTTGVRRVVACRDSVWRVCARRDHLRDREMYRVMQTDCGVSAGRERSDHSEVCRDRQMSVPRTRRGGRVQPSSSPGPGSVEFSILAAHFRMVFASAGSGAGRGRQKGLHPDSPDGAWVCRCAHPPGFRRAGGLPAGDIASEGTRR